MEVFLIKSYAKRYIKKNRKNYSVSLNSWGNR